MGVTFRKVLLLGSCVIRIKGSNLTLVRFNSMIKIAQNYSKFCIFASSNLFDISQEMMKKRMIGGKVRMLV